MVSYLYSRNPVPVRPVEPLKTRRQKGCIIMKNRKKFPSLVLAMVMMFLACIFLLSACQTAEDDHQTVELPPEPEDGVLTYAALNPVTRELQSSVERFNEAHTDVQIEIRDYSDDAGPQRLLLELAAGRVPDLMELQRIGRVSVSSDPSAESLWFGEPMAAGFQSGDEWMPYRQLAQRGYLEDLWPYIENDPDFGREGVLEAPLKAAEVNGGLYMLFSQVSINILMGPKAVVGERLGWTLDDLIEAFSAMPAGSTILRYNATQRDVFFKLLSAELNQYVDWETGQCSFENEEFRGLLAFLSSFPSTFESSLAPEQMEEELVWKLVDGEQLLEPVKIGLLRDMPEFDTYFASGASYIGYPTADGSLGSSFIIHGNKLAMSSACQDKDAAWEFMRQMIQRRYNPNDMRTAHQNQKIRIPINRRDYELGNRVDMEREAEDIPPRFTFYGGPSYAVAVPTEDDLQLFEQLIGSTTQIYWPDDALASVVWESIGPYLAGDKSLDDTVALVQGRVSLYVNEQR